jgi:hypothetical protein
MELITEFPKIKKLDIFQLERIRHTLIGFIRQKLPSNYQWEVLQTNPYLIADLETPPPDMWIESQFTRQIILTIDLIIYPQEQRYTHIQSRVTSGLFGIREAMIVDFPKGQCLKYIASQHTILNCGYSVFLGLNFNELLKQLLPTLLD